MESLQRVHGKYLSHRPSFRSQPADSISLKPSIKSNKLIFNSSCSSLTPFSSTTVFDALAHHLSSGNFKGQQQQDEQPLHSCRQPTQKNRNMFLEVQFTPANKLCAIYWLAAAQRWALAAPRISSSTSSGWIGWCQRWSSAATGPPQQIHVVAHALRSNRTSRTMHSRQSSRGRPAESDIKLPEMSSNQCRRNFSSQIIPFETRHLTTIWLSHSC